MSDSLRYHKLWHIRLPSPSVSRRVCSNLCPFYCTIFVSFHPYMSPILWIFSYSSLLFSKINNYFLIFLFLWMHLFYYPYILPFTLITDTYILIYIYLLMLSARPGTLTTYHSNLCTIFNKLPYLLIENYKNGNI